MPNIKPISDLQNYSDVLHDVAVGAPVFLTKNGRGRYAILDMQDFEKTQATLRLMNELVKDRKSGEEKGWLTLEAVEKNLGLLMNNLHLSEEAQNDLFEIKSYNEEELLNPSAALATVSRITKSLRILQNYAQTGAPLSSIADIESDYRFIISDNYISFYRAYGSEVYIDRILYARRDYMRILFGDSTTDK